MEKHNHILGRQLTMGQDPSSVWRGGPSISPAALHSVALDTSDEALQWFHTNQHSNYLLQREHAVKSDGVNYT